MFKTLIIKEIRDIIGSLKFAVLFGLCSVLIIMAFFLGARNFQVLQAQYESATRENLRQLEGITDWTRVEPQVYLPPSVLASLISGVANDVGRSVQIQAGAAELIPEHTRYGEDPIYAAFRFLDLEFVFQVVLSLVAVLLAYNAVNGEKEEGTLKLIFANAVPRDRFITAKLLGTLAATVIPLLIPILIGCGILAAMQIPLSPQEWLRFGWIIVGGLLYFGVFLNVSALVSARTERSSHSFLFLLMIWIFVVLIVPRTAVLVAGRAVDVPSVDEINSQKFRFQSQLFNEHFQKIGAFRATSTDPEASFKEFNEFMEKARAERDKKASEFIERLNEDRHNRQKVQREWAFNLARISPATSFSLYAMGLAGTSSVVADRFGEAVQNYKQTFTQFVKAKTGTNPSGNIVMLRMDGDSSEKPKPINPHELPAFTMEGVSWNVFWSGAVLDLSILILLNFIFFTGAVFAFLKFDLR